MTAKRRILVVDDAEGIRSYLASLLELRGFQVDTVDDGQSALALLGSGVAPDLIIRDVMMPGIDAVTAFQSLLEEVEESAGDLPLREVGRKASLKAEREAIERVLIQTNWNRKRAARLIQVSYKTLLQKIRECGLEPI